MCVGPANPAELWICLPFSLLLSFGQAKERRESMII